MITELEFKEAAKEIGCKVAAIKAVYDVEAAGRGFLPDGRVKILFEGHRFWKQLVKNGFNPIKFISTYAGSNNTAQVQSQLSAHGLTKAKVLNVLYKDWTKKHYKGGPAEWDRMSAAVAICKMIGAPVELAQKSASYGSFQILGENCELAGYATANEMAYDYSKGEFQQLLSFIKFVKAKGLDDELRLLNWAGFAKGYNGSKYRENQYDLKLASRFRFHDS